jgi:aryl-alcohol dehydrogenase-like predicted oxidoreductase
VGLGSAPLGSTLDGPLWWGSQDHDVAVDTVLAAIEAGAAFIATAPFYGWGRPERIVGEALGQAVLASLERLGLARIDVVQVHDWDAIRNVLHPDYVYTEFRFTGTHTGDFEGIAPTGNSVEINFCNVMHLQDGKVITERDYLDTHGLLEQLGAG